MQWNMDHSRHNIEDVAAGYDALPTYDPKAESAWKALADESKGHADFIRKHLNVSETDNPEPYDNSEQMINDIRNNRNFVVSTANSEHPIWTPEENVNFRIVHDVFGHAATDGDFGWHGENDACSTHFGLSSPEARKALATECLGQTGYAINRGNFTDQKVGFIPGLHEGLTEANKDAPVPTREQLMHRALNGPQKTSKWKIAANPATEKRIQRMIDKAQSLGYEVEQHKDENGGIMTDIHVGEFDYHYIPTTQMLYIYHGNHKTLVRFNDRVLDSDERVSLAMAESLINQLEPADPPEWHSWHKDYEDKGPQTIIMSTHGQRALAIGDDAVETTFNAVPETHDPSEDEKIQMVDGKKKKWKMVRPKDHTQEDASYVEPKSGWGFYSKWKISVPPADQAKEFSEGFEQAEAPEELKHKYPVRGHRWELNAGNLERLYNHPKWRLETPYYVQALSKEDLGRPRGVKSMDEWSSLMGEHHPPGQGKAGVKSGAIFINPLLSPEAANEALWHELQHAYQHQEKRWQEHGNDYVNPLELHNRGLSDEEIADKMKQYYEHPMELDANEFADYMRKHPLITESEPHYNPNWVPEEQRQMAQELIDQYYAEHGSKHRLRLPSLKNSKWKIANDRTGNPKLDALIEKYIQQNTVYDIESYQGPDWKTAPLDKIKESLGDESLYNPLHEMKDFEAATNACGVLSRDFARFLIKNGVEADTYSQNPKDLYPHSPRTPMTEGHCVTKVIVDNKTYLIDWTAAQYGFNNFPKITTINKQSKWKKISIGLWDPENTEPSRYFDTKVVEEIPIDVAMQMLDFERGKEDYERENIDNLVQNISQNGFLEPVIIDFNENNNTAFITEGNHRVQAAKQLGMEWIPARAVRSVGGKSRFREIPVRWQGTQKDAHGDLYIPPHFPPSMLGIPVKEKVQGFEDNPYYNGWETKESRLATIKEAPARSKAQFRYMQGICNGSIEPPEGMTKAQACEYVAGQKDYKDLPDKASHLNPVQKLVKKKELQDQLVNHGFSPKAASLISLQELSKLSYYLPGHRSAIALRDPETNDWHLDIAPHESFTHQGSMADYISDLGSPAMRKFIKEEGPNEYYHRHLARGLYNPETNEFVHMSHPEGIDEYDFEDPSKEKREMTEKFWQDLAERHDLPIEKIRFLNNYTGEYEDLNPDDIDIRDVEMPWEYKRQLMLHHRNRPLTPGEREQGGYDTKTGSRYLYASKWKIAKEKVWEIILDGEEGYDIIGTGSFEECRKKTEEWLKDFIDGYVNYETKDDAYPIPAKAKEQDKIALAELEKAEDTGRWSFYFDYDKPFDLILQPFEEKKKESKWKIAAKKKIHHKHYSDLKNHQKAVKHYGPLKTHNVKNFKKKSVLNEGQAQELFGQDPYMYHDVAAARTKNGQNEQVTTIDSILKNGILPKEQTGVSEYSDWLTSRPHHAYVGKETFYPKSRVPALRIDMSKVDPSTLAPDEDLFPSFGYSNQLSHLIDFHNVKNPPFEQEHPEGATLGQWAHEHSHLDTPKNVKASRDLIGAIAVKGGVPADAVHFNPKWLDKIEYEVRFNIEDPDADLESDRKLMETILSNEDRIPNDEWDYINPIHELYNELVAEIERRRGMRQSKWKIAKPNLVPPEGVRAAARRGIKYHAEGKAGDGFEAATLDRAHKIANGEELTPEHVKRMHSFFERHAGGRSQKAKKGEVTPWDVAWLAWGGNAGRSWAAGKVKELERSEKTSKNCKCWDGYKRVPGTKPCEPGSCEKCDKARKESKWKIIVSSEDLYKPVIKPDLSPLEPGQKLTIPEWWARKWEWRQFDKAYKQRQKEYKKEKKQKEKQQQQEQQQQVQNFMSGKQSKWKIADYQGWTNWETWNTNLMMANEYELSKHFHNLAAKGASENQFIADAIGMVVGPYNQQLQEDFSSMSDEEEVEMMKKNQEEDWWRNAEKHHPDDYLAQEDYVRKMKDLTMTFMGEPEPTDIANHWIDESKINWNEIYNYWKRNAEAEGNQII